MRDETQSNNLMHGRKNQVRAQKYDTPSAFYSYVGPGGLMAGCQGKRKMSWREKTLELAFEV